MTTAVTEITSSDALSELSASADKFPKTYPYKLEFSFQLNLFGGWFVFFSTAETTQTSSVRRTVYTPANNPTYYDVEKGPYPVTGVERVGLLKLDEYLTKLDVPKGYLGEITYTLTALDPASLSWPGYESLELDVVDVDNVPGWP